MHLEEDRAKEIKHALVAHQKNLYPPRSVIEAVAHLLGPEEIVGALGTRDEAGRWRCVLSTDAHIVYVEAAREDDRSYSLDSDDGHTELVANMWRHDQIARLDLAELREFGNAWDSQAVYRVVMADGVFVLVPPDGNYVHSAAEQELEKILVGIRSATRS